MVNFLAVLFLFAVSFNSAFAVGDTLSESTEEALKSAELAQADADAKWIETKIDQWRLPHDEMDYDQLLVEVTKKPINYDKVNERLRLLTSKIAEKARLSKRLI